MRVPAALVVAVCGWVGFSGTVRADDAGWEAVAHRVDQLLVEAWARGGVAPAPPADDATFLRRASLDLTGRIPTVGEVRSFLQEGSPDKRRRLIDALLAKPSHAAHLATIWRGVMLPANSNFVQFGQSLPFENWLQGHFADNTPYDVMVRELLTVRGQFGTTGPVVYYAALEAKPEELAASTSRIFLGVQIQCAQCHNHPFDHWTQRDFWGYAAFFARLSRPQGQQQFVTQVADVDTGEVTLPDTDEVVAPQYLGGVPAGDAAGQTRRQQLAAWLTSRENPYFARAAVNRVWALMFGYGLVHPVDDFGEHNPPSQPEVLDVLSADFAAHGFDLRRLFRILANTRAYQLSSRVTAGDAPSQPHLFHRMSVKSLSAEQIYDCLAEATRRRQAVDSTGQQAAFGGRFDQVRQAFVSRFEAPTQGATEFQAGILQALTMMNGSVVADVTDVARSDMLIALNESPFFTDAQRVEILFLGTLSRQPTEEERSRLVRYVETGGAARDRSKALADVLWALLNSTEFILNH